MKLQQEIRNIRADFDYTEEGKRQAFLAVKEPIEIFLEEEFDFHDEGRSFYNEEIDLSGYEFLFLNCGEASEVQARLHLQEGFDHVRIRDSTICGYWLQIGLFSGCLEF